jgi:hypothetical protein
VITQAVNLVIAQIINIISKWFHVFIQDRGAWKSNQTVLELYFWEYKLFVLPRRDSNTHHWYTASPIA